MLLAAFVFAYGLLCAAEPLRFCLSALGIMKSLETSSAVAPNALIVCGELVGTKSWLSRLVNLPKKFSIDSSL